MDAVRPATNDHPAPRWHATQPTGQADTTRAIELLAGRLPETLRVFAEIAYDLAWSWRPGGEDLFRCVDPYRWEASYHNPVRFLLETPLSELERAAANADLVARAEGLRDSLREARSRPFQETGRVSAERPVAFLCAEYGLHRCLPIYAGGLGILAGDIVKQASDSGLPLAAVGLFYRQGYMHQRLDPSGWQHEYWVRTDPDLLPLARISNSDGTPRLVTVRIRGHEVVFRIWRVVLGRVSLYLLDAHRERNPRIDRWITARLYDSSRDMRLAQYAALGLGGIRALRALGIEPGLVHLNEGHAALAALELAREERAAGRSEQEALASARERIVFTTHTPVAAGNESYTAAELESALPGLAEEVGLEREGLLALGRVHPEDRDEPFGLTVLALRTSHAANGVSRRHGEVARSMWQRLWPERAPEQVPVGHVTNGVHLPTWMAEPMRALLEKHLGVGFEERAADPAVWEAVEAIPDAELWTVRRTLRSTLVEFLRDRSIADRLARNESLSYVEAAANAFDPEVLTIGFARRVAAYKRLQLLVHDPGRAVALLRPPHPAQVVIAGKAHPLDDEAKRLVQRIFTMKRAEGVAGHVIFLEDYGMGLAAPLVAGCDVWVNLPRPPLEASGTSGMKCALNGVLNLSVLDGWWQEAWDGENGWALPDEAVSDEHARDARDAAALYDLLERQVAPIFYDRDAAGVPVGWVRRVKASLRTLGPRFCAQRMLTDYVNSTYTSR